jgi:hypothetical protein
MNKRLRLTQQEVVYIINAFTNELETVISLAEHFGITRQGIYRVLRKAGIDVAHAGKMTVSCTVCGEETTKARCQVRKSKHLFCSSKCYFAWLQHGNGNPFVQHRNSGRIARHIVSKSFALRPENIVHHEDRNQFNNHLSNLKVFKNNGDHVRYHRGFIVPILWDGKILGI